MTKMKTCFMFFTIILIGCDSSKKSPELKYEFCAIAEILKTADSSKIRSITSKKAFESLKLTSNSLKDTSRLSSIAIDLCKFNLSTIEVRDSIIVIPLGKEDEITGTTNGYMFILKTRSSYKIEDYKFGK